MSAGEVVAGRCPVCMQEATSVEDHTEGPVRKLHETIDQASIREKTWRLYRPCGHAVESRSEFPRFHLDRWVTSPAYGTVAELVDFLLARFAEDEAETRARIDEWGHPVYDEDDPPSRELLTYEAMRRIVERCTPLADVEVRRQTRTLAYDTLVALALPYADHPDFREEWRA